MMNTEPHRIVGRTDTPASGAKCLECKQPFKGGIKGDPGVNVYTKDGMREVAITGMCELCFDGLFDESEDEDELAGPPGSSFFCECDLQATVSEQDAGKCGQCGKEFFG